MMGKGLRFEFWSQFGTSLLLYRAYEKAPRAEDRAGLEFFWRAQQDSNLRPPV